LGPASQRTGTRQESTPVAHFISIYRKFGGMENIERTIALTVIAQQQLRDLRHFLNDDGLAAVSFKSLEITLGDLELEIRQFKKRFGGQ